MATLHKGDNDIIIIIIIIIFIIIIIIIIINNFEVCRENIQDKRQFTEAAVEREGNVCKGCGILKDVNYEDVCLSDYRKAGNQSCGVPQ